MVGLGTNQYSVETPEEMDQLQEVLETMVQLGGSVIDTARVYGRAAGGDRTLLGFTWLTLGTQSFPDAGREVLAPIGFA